MKLHIGLDDTDSPRGGCTTYVGALLVERLEAIGAEFMDYPNLIRLNPNIPWKTRGNGAVCLRIGCERGLLCTIREEVFRIIEENSDLSSLHTDPGVVIYEGDVPSVLTDFSRRTITGVVEVDEAHQLIRELGAIGHSLKGERGLIGALAAVGETLSGDHTYEFLAYRTPENRGTKRRVNIESVFKMDTSTASSTFNNVDPETRRVIMTPHGPDPILFGIRGETPEAVYEAAQMAVSEEPIERWVIFRTNQGTDSHFTSVKPIADLRVYNPEVIEGLVKLDPEVISGGHVILRVGDETGEVDCAAYEPTGSLRKIVRELVPGDTIRVYGGAKPHVGRNGITLNIEKLDVLRLTEKIGYENPLCPMCRGRMESMGRRQGYRCRRCGFRGVDMKKAAVSLSRCIKEGSYLPPPRAQRHLTKPFKRCGHEKTSAEIRFVEQWHS